MGLTVFRGQYWLFDVTKLPGKRAAACRNPACGDVWSVTRRRGLCNHCYRNLVVRDRHAMLREVGLGALTNDLPGTPKEPRDATGACPGSAEKIAVMRARYLRREALHHRGDCGELALTALQEAERRMEGERRKLAAKEARRGDLALVRG